MLLQLKKYKIIMRIVKYAILTQWAQYHKLYEHELIRGPSLTLICASLVLFVAWLIGGTNHFSAPHLIWMCYYYSIYVYIVVDKFVSQFYVNIMLVVRNRTYVRHSEYRRVHKVDIIILFGSVYTYKENV